jgi:alpha-1,2-mannosyltransferase
VLLGAGATTSAAVFIVVVVLGYHLDFDVYRTGGRAVLNGIPLYRGAFSVGGTHLPFTYPPLAALLFTPFSALPMRVGGVLFILLSLAAIAVTVAVVIGALASEAGRRLPPNAAWWAALASLPVVVWLWPVTSTMLFGQINALLMALVVADLLLPRTPWPRGTLVGLAAAIKLTPAVFGLYFLLRRQAGPARTCVVSAFSFTALAALVLPRDSLEFWTHAMLDPSRVGGLMYSANQSWRGALARFVDEPMQSEIWVALIIATAVLAIWAMVRQLRVGAFAAAMCTNALLGLLISPVSWAHHWVWLLPVLLVCGASWAWGGHRSARAMFLLTAVISTIGAVHLWYPSTGDVERHWTIAMKITGSEFVLLAVAWLVVCGLWPRLMSPAASRPATSRRAGAPHPAPADSPHPTSPAAPRPASLNRSLPTRPEFAPAVQKHGVSGVIGTTVPDDRGRE